MGRKVVKEKETIYPDHSEDPTIPDGNEENEQGDFSQGEVNMIQWFESMGGGATLKAKVFMLDDEGNEQYVGEIVPSDVNDVSPEEMIKERFGGGRFLFKMIDAATKQTTTVGPITIIAPKKLGARTLPGSGINVNMPAMPSGTGDMGAILGVVMQNNANMMMMLQQANENTSKMLVEAFKASNRPHESAQTSSLKEAIEIVTLLEGRNKKDAWTLERIIDTARTVIEVAQPFLGGGIIPDSPVMFLLQQAAPNIKNAIDAVAERMRQPQPTAPAPIISNRLLGQPDAQPEPHVHVGATPTAPAAPVATGVSAPDGIPGLPDKAARLGIRKQFQDVYLQRVLAWAAEDVDPYACSLNFAAFVPDSRLLLPLIDMSSPADFYTVYPQALHFKPWFDELFEYILDPALKPEPEEDAAPAEVVATEATEAPKNGRGKGRAKVVETHQ